MASCLTRASLPKHLLLPRGANLDHFVDIGTVIQSGKDLLISEGEWITPLAALIAVLGIPSLRSLIFLPFRPFLRTPSADEIGRVQSSIDYGTLMKTQSGLLERLKLRLGFSPKTIMFIEKRDRCNWSMGSISGEPAMHITGHWYATNLMNREIFLLNTELQPQPIQSHLLVKEPDGMTFGDFPLIPGLTTEVIGDFWVKPPIRSNKKSLRGSVKFTDSLGDVHKIRDVVFTPRVPRQIKQIALRKESVAELGSQIEKTIASVLKDEVNRYSQNSRMAGGLGSIYLKRGSMTKATHIYQDGWTRGSGRQQEIFDESEFTLIETINGDTLVKYFNKLELDTERQIFINALIDRIDNKREYLGVSYLIVYVLKRIGYLRQALSVVNEKLPFRRTVWDIILRRKHNEFLLPEEHRHGHSNVFAMLGGMLRWEHRSFSEEEMDAIEHAIGETNEHTFRIDKKLAAVRAHRLGTYPIG